MKKYILAYKGEIETFIKDELNTSDAKKIEGVLKEFELKITYFQHERLIHLIVTVLFALLEMISIYAMLSMTSLITVVLCFMFLVLLVPYIMHYYFLENSVQEMYKLRDTIISRLKFLSDNK